MILQKIRLLYYSLELIENQFIVPNSALEFFMKYFTNKSTVYNKVQKRRVLYMYHYINPLLHKKNPQFSDVSPPKNVCELFKSSTAPECCN